MNRITNLHRIVLATSLAAVGLVATTSATAVPITDTYTGNGGSITATYFGEVCPGTCTDFASAGYSVSGGAVVSPASTESGVHKTPGEDTGNSSNVEAYNVTSANDDPDGAASPIEVDNLQGSFDLYWGSVDSYNDISFSINGDPIVTFTGTDANELAGDPGDPQNFDFDGYFSFSGDFNEATLNSINGVAFEAASSVPEPGTLALLGLGLVGIGTRMRAAR